MSDSEKHLSVQLLHSVNGHKMNTLDLGKAVLQIHGDLYVSWIHTWYNSLPKISSLLRLDVYYAPQCLRTKQETRFYYVTW